MVECLKCGWRTPSLWTMREHHQPGGGCEIPSADGSQSSSGVVGAPGRLTRVSEILDRARTDAYTTPGDGWNTFQGRLSDILLPSRLDVAGVAILMAFYDSRTLRRLHDQLCGGVGSTATVDVGCSRMIVSVEPRTT